MVTYRDGLSDRNPAKQDEDALGRGGSDRDGSSKEETISIKTG
jgi:hypothetical protein